jgi:hypothetical protein
VFISLGDLQVSNCRKVQNPLHTVESADLRVGGTVFSGGRDHAFLLGFVELTVFLIQEATGRRAFDLRPTIHHNNDEKASQGEFSRTRFAMPMPSGDERSTIRTEVMGMATISNRALSIFKDACGIHDLSDVEQPKIEVLAEQLCEILKASKQREKDQLERH